jgi:hypothetical protein
MKIRKTFLEMAETIQMKNKMGMIENDPRQMKLFSAKDDDEFGNYSIESTPEIKEIYDKVRTVTDNPKELEKLKQISIQRGMTREAFNKIAMDVKNEKQPFLNKEMKKAVVANMNVLQKDIKKLNSLFNDIKKSSVLNNLYKQSLRVILKKFFTIPGAKIAKRYIILPLRYNNTNQSINELNKSDNKYEQVFRNLNTDIQPEKIDDEIIEYLTKYDYKLEKEDLYNNVCYTKNGAQLKITDELEKIKNMFFNIENKIKSLEKVPADKKQFIQKEIDKIKDFKLDYLIRVLSFNTDRSGGIGNEKVVIVTWVPRLILTQSTGTAWTSCQHLITGSYKESVITSMQEGVFIAWLVSLKDAREVKKPLARILIKPFKAKTGDNIIWWTSKIYSESGGDFTLFKKVVNSFLYFRQNAEIEKGGGTSASFALMSKKQNNYKNDEKTSHRIYPDSETGLDIKKIKFDDIINKKIFQINNLIETIDFSESKLLKWLKNLDKAKLKKLINDSDLISATISINLTTVFSYLLNFMRNENMHKLYAIFFDNDIDNQICKIYLNFIENEHAKNGFKNIFTKNLFIVYADSNKYMINSLINTKVFKTVEMLNENDTDLAVGAIENKLSIKDFLHILNNNLLDEKSKKIVLNKIMPLVDLKMNDMKEITRLIISVNEINVNKENTMVKDFVNKFNSRIDDYIKKDKDFIYINHLFENQSFALTNRYMIPTVLKFIVYLSEHNEKLLIEYADDVSVYFRELLENCASLNSDGDNIINSFNIIEVFRKLKKTQVVNVKQALIEHFTENEDYDLFKRIIDDIKKPEDFDYMYDMISKLSMSRVIGEGKTLQGQVFIFHFLHYIKENLHKFENKSETVLYVMNKYKKEVKLSYKYNSLAVDQLFKNFSGYYTVNFDALKQDKFYEFIKECLEFISEEIKIDFLATMLEYISAFERYFKITMENLDMPKLIKNIKKIRVLDDDLEEAETFLAKLSEEFVGCVLAGDVQVNVLKFVKDYNLYELIAEQYLNNLKDYEHTIYLFTLNENNEENKRRLIDLHNLFSSHDPEFKNKLYSITILTDYYSFSEMIIDLMDSKVNLQKFRIAAEYLNYEKNKKTKEEFVKACLHALTGFSSKTKKEKIINLIKNLMLLFYNKMRFDNVAKDRSLERIFCLIKKQELLDIFKEIKYSNYEEKIVDKIYQ